MSKSFLYANGVVSSRTNNLITKDCFNRMIDAKDAKEALNILQETNFGAGLTVDSSFEVENLLNFETKKLLNFVKEESPLEALSQYFLLPFDYANISSYCKGLILQQDTFDFVEAEGNYEWGRIKDLISSKNFSGFNNKYIEEALKLFQELSAKNDLKGFEIDFLFKNYLYKNLLDVCKKDRVLKDLVAVKVDIENISTAMRSPNQAMFEKQVMKGNLSFNTLTKLFNKDNSVLMQIENPILNKFAVLSLKEDKSSSFVEFEVLKNCFVFEQLNKDKYNIDSLAPFALYCFQKEAEIKNVRLIMSYQNNNLKDKIKQRFLEYYGG